MLSWAGESLLEDGRAQSDVRQGVTLEVMGEGSSMGPLTEAMKEELTAQSMLGVQAEWTTLGEFLEHLERNGVAPNVASFVGTATVREHELGADDRPPTADELPRMQALVRHAMEEGAVGVSSALVYAPAFYAATDELVALARTAGEHGGMYTSHLRSEGNQLLEALDELLHIAQETGVRAEIYHLKAAGKPNWSKLEPVVDRIEDARRDGLAVTADMYTYTAGATGLNGAMPPWVQEGGFQAWRAPLSNPDLRGRVEHEMTTDTDEWENMFLLAGPENMRLLAFRNDRLRPLTGRGLLELGNFADLVAFDPQRIQDHATYDDPHRYATGVVHVAVNGTLVLRDGEHTGALPGRVVRGPGWRGTPRSARLT